MDDAKLVEAADTAAEWWANELRTNRTFDNGDTSSLLAALAALTAQHRDVISDAAVLTFRTAVSTMVLAELRRGLRAHLRVDYGAEGILASALRAASLPVDNPSHHLPWKTYMGVAATHIECRKGYGAPWVVLWGSKPPVVEED